MPRSNAQRAAATPEQIAWYERSGHCGACGEPGVFCVCTTPCGCAHLHECGSGLLASAAETFAVDVGPVATEQGELFE